jgi:hypothetical protein
MPRPLIQDQRHNPDSHKLASELENFKTNIDLRHYAVAQGYQLDGNKSWRGSAVMRDATGDKIIISRQDDGHFVYWSVRDGSDHGTIIDFVKHRRKGLSIGQVREELRRWSEGSSAMTQGMVDELQTVRKDRRKIQREFSLMKLAHGQPYLQIYRAIPCLLLRYWRFEGMVRTDRRGNAVFPHYDLEGLCGYEMKNQDFTSFAPGGTKGLWLSRTILEDNRIVICESAIDAMSHSVLFQDGRARYASLGGTPTRSQVGLVQREMAKMPLESEIVAAMDADKAGRALAEMVRRAFATVGRGDRRFRSEEPKGFKDWNDQLRGNGDSA